MNYPDVPSAIKPVPHGTEIPILTPPDNLDSSSDSCEEMNVMDKSATYEPATDLTQSKPLNQAELNDLTRDLCFSKESAQLLGSRLKENHLFLQQQHSTGIEIAKNSFVNTSHWIKKLP